MKCTTSVTLFILASFVSPFVSQNKTIYELELCHLRGFSCDDLECDDLPKTEFCSCVQSCSIFGDCCHGVESYYERCDESGIIQDDLVEKDVDNLECVEPATGDISQSYFMIAKCTESWGEVDNCRGDGNQTYGRLEDGLKAIPVMSLKTGLSYKNMFCAICNGESLDDIEYWGVWGECDYTQLKELGKLDVPDSINFMFSVCYDARLAPSENYMRDFLFFFPCYGPSFENMTDRCPLNYNFTSKPHLPRFCKEIYAPMSVEDNLFKNQYCAECHFDVRPYEELFFLECDQHGSGSPFGWGGLWSLRNPLRGRFTFLPISVTLALPQSEGTEASLCETREIYDELVQKCMRVNCQDGYYFNGKECMSIPNRDETSCNYTKWKAIVRLSDNSLGGCDVKLGECWSNCLLDLLDLDYVETESLKTSIDVDEKGRIIVVVHFSDLHVEKKQYENVPLKGNLKISYNYRFCKHIEDIDVVTSCQSFEKHLCFSDWMTSDQFFVHIGETDVALFGSLSGTANVQNFSLSEMRIKHTFLFSKVKKEVIHDRFYQVASFHGYPCKDLDCETTILNTSSFVPVSDGSMTLVYVSDPTVRLSPDQYKLRGGGYIEVCDFYQKRHTTLDLISKVIYVIGTSLSIFALVFCVITYGTFPQLRSSVSKVLTMVICINLLVASLNFAVVNVASISRIWCVAVAWAIHFFFLTTFATSSVIGVHFIRTFSFKPRSSQTNRLTWPNIGANLAGCYGVPCIVSVTLLVCHVTIPNNRIKYGDETICLVGDEHVNLWAFTIPAGICVVFNTFSFIYVTLSIYFQTKGKKSMAKVQRKAEDFRTFLVFFKISALLGLTWLFGFLGILTGQKLIVFIFDVLTPFQGFLIFASFMCKRKTWKLWKQQLKGKVRPQNATGTSKTSSRTSPTTQRTASERTGPTATQFPTPYTITGGSK